MRSEQEVKEVDGCATFYLERRFALLESRLIDLAAAALHRPELHDNYGNIFSRVMKRDNIAVVTFLQNRQTGTRTIVANTHFDANPSFQDVKDVQAAVLLEELTNVAFDYAARSPFNYSFFSPVTANVSTGVRHPLTAPPVSYPTGNDIPLILAGDFNSLPSSAVYQLLSTGHLPPAHPDFDGYTYGNLTTNGFSHPSRLTSAYAQIDTESFTMYSPNLKGTIDYIWYNAAGLQATSILGPVDDTYTKKVPGFPSKHFSSDHVKLVAEFVIRKKKTEREKMLEFLQRNR